MTFSTTYGAAMNTNTVRLFLFGSILLAAPYFLFSYAGSTYAQPSYAVNPAGRDRPYMKENRPADPSRMTPSRYFGWWWMYNAWGGTGSTGACDRKPATSTAPQHMHGPAGSQGHGYDDDDD